MGKEYDRGQEDAYSQAKEDVQLDNLVVGVPREPCTEEETEEARVEVEEQIKQHIKERNDE